MTYRCKRCLDAREDYRHNLRKCIRPIPLYILFWLVLISLPLYLIGGLVIGCSQGIVKSYKVWWTELSEIHTIIPNYYSGELNYMEDNTNDT